MSACERHTHRVLPLGRSTPGARRRAHTGRARVAESRAPTSLRRVAAGGAVLGPAALVKRLGHGLRGPGARSPGSGQFSGVWLVEAGLEVGSAVWSIYQL